MTERTLPTEPVPAAAYLRGQRRDNVVTLAKGGAITLVGSIGAYVLGLAFNVVVARRIGADLYGIYSLGLTVVTIATTFAALGLTRGAQRFIAIYHHDRDHAHLRGTIFASIGLVAVVSTAAAVGLIAVAPVIAREVFHEPRLTPALRILALSIPFGTLTDLLSAMTQGFRVMHYKVFFDDLLQNFLRVAIGFGLLILGWRLGAVLWSWVVPSAIAAGLMLASLNRIYPLARRRAGVAFEPRALLRFSLPLHMSNLVRFLQGRTELLVLGALGTARAAGIYNVSLRVSIVGALLVNAFIAIAAPMITTLHHRGDLAGLEQLFKVVTKWLLVVNLPLALTTIILAGPLLDIFGKEFAMGATALAILAVGRLIDAGTGIGGALLNMVGRSDVSLINAILSLVISLIFDFALIPPFGLLGAAIAATLAIAAVNAIRLVEIYRLLRIHPWSRELWKLTAAGALGVGATLIARATVIHAETVVGVLASAAILWAVYGGALAALGLDESDAVIIDATRRKVGDLIRSRGRVAPAGRR